MSAYGKARWVGYGLVAVFLAALVIGCAFLTTIIFIPTDEIPGPIKSPLPTPVSSSP